VNAATRLEHELFADAMGQLSRRPRLLVVDDQAINVQTLYQAFSGDHQVFMATSGAQALTACIAKRPDLILLDVQMPGMDGYEVCRRLKAEEDTRDIPVIFVTAHNDEAAETLGLDVGAVDFISKPINPKIVRARVKTHLTLKAQSDLLRRMVYTDGLTGVHNRRHFDERLNVEWSRAMRSGAPLGVVMLDVDFFKRYNDHYGHQAGDDALRQVAGALKSALKRPADLVARYGGEEFVCLLPETDLDGAIALAQELRERVLSLGIEHANSSAHSHLSISVGACTKPAGVTGSAEELLRQSDCQLYLAKSGGRNCVQGALLSNV
jgi:diguanylate cyclase (GGDEF)-like protein